MRLKSNYRDITYRNNLFFLNKDGTINENPHDIMSGKFYLTRDPEWGYLTLERLDEEPVQVK